MDDDAQLAAIRQKRIEELKNKSGGEVSNEQIRQQEEAQRDAEERRQAILAQIIQADAKERLSRIGLVKPDKQRQIENLILAQAQSGRLGGKVTEEELIQLLEQINEKVSTTSKVTFQRRRNIMDDDEDE